MRHVLLALLALWLGLNLYLLATGGVERLRSDWRERHGDAARKRAAAWQAQDNAAAWRELEERLAALEASGCARILFASGPGSGPFAALAQHRLFPCRVIESPRDGRDLAELRRAAQACGAGAVLYREPDGSWQTESVAAP